METQNPIKLGNDLKQIRTRRRNRNDGFRFSADEMKAPVRDDAVGAVRAITFFTITDDEVMRSRDLGALLIPSNAGF